MALNKTTQDRIKADADKAYPIANGWHTDYAVNMGYIAGATAENERAQGLVDALQWIKTYGPCDSLTVNFIDKVLQQFKDGGKEVGKPIVIEYMPILSAELRELKDIANVPMRVPMHLLNERQAYSNHGQSLQRLKERGGLSVKEAISLITLKNWGYYRGIPMNEAVLLLNELIANPPK